ncbi:caspase family protein [Rhizobium leguminosarum]|uniref:caspase family protein n=1 Tax=Rhizobium leguminosarum TaxID=384 RepID=UPI00144149ED|nr:caspase family protein [Rhizobium leguminosarum]MBY5841305.1 caspase family protein [Rhizobium leguminosarum]NKM80936.1 hypothetical protein [Rhizobium leguminosarum bv. viciae]QSZ07288.1 caspase family protein [Rhizobium leguminosarum]
MPRSSSLVYERSRHGPATHVFIVGVGEYEFGRGRGESEVAENLDQLTSPPISARAVADWFIEHFDNPDAPLGSVSLLISGDTSLYTRKDGHQIDVERADLRSVKAAIVAWERRISSHPDNIAVFYFCGHGISSGQKAALLLSDYGHPDYAYEPAIDLDLLKGTLRNSNADRQLFLFDCCRTNADGIYDIESTIGSRILSVPRRERTGTPAQTVMFATVAGAEAYGIEDGVSIFTSCFLDAVNFAAINDDTGPWVATTASIFGAIGRLVNFRVSERLRRNSTPNLADATDFDFNHRPAPATTRSIVAISDKVGWQNASISCHSSFASHRDVVDRLGHEHFQCCIFNLDSGDWEISADLVPENARVKSARCRLNGRPVVYIRLEGAE